MQKVKNSKGKLKISEVGAGGGQGDVAEIELRETSGWNAKSKEFLKKTKDFRGQWGGRDQGVAQKLSREWR